MAAFLEKPVSSEGAVNLCAAPMKSQAGMRAMAPGQPTPERIRGGERYMLPELPPKTSASK